jgi:dipeptidyl aminopeptidase/acylaminoacyl peptidase
MSFTVVVILIAFGVTLSLIIKRQLDIFVTPVRQTNLTLPPNIDLNYEEVRFKTSDGLTIAGWYVAGRRPEAIILVHGINANRLAMLPEALILHEAGYQLLLIDLRGHGHSEGQYITYGYREAYDVQAAVEYLATRPEVEHIGVLGTSLGGAAVARAAALEPRLEAVVIESSYSSLPAAVEDAFDDFSLFPQWPFAPLLIGLAEWRVGVKIDEVDSARDLATLSPRPVLIIHGRLDKLFPPEHAQRMYAAAQEPKELWLLDQSDHGNPALDQPLLFRAKVVSFFERAFGE